MEEASLHTTIKHLFISTQYYDKHGVPPTKRLFKVAMLDPSLEFIGSWGMSGDLGDLPIVVKEEDSITDVENAVFDLGVMDSLCFLFVDQRVFIGMITKFIKFIELNFSVISAVLISKFVCVRGPDNDIKFLEQQNPPEQSWLSILLSTQGNLRAEYGSIYTMLLERQDMEWKFLESIPLRQNPACPRILREYLHRYRSSLDQVGQFGSEVSEESVPLKSNCTHFPVSFQASDPINGKGNGLYEFHLEFSVCSLLRDTMNGIYPEVVSESRNHRFCKHTDGIESHVQEIASISSIRNSLPPKGVKDGEREIDSLGSEVEKEWDCHFSEISVILEKHYSSQAMSRNIDLVN
ncbi:hypothetical protein Tco_0664133 [Tanacetum coccineum]